MSDTEEPPTKVVKYEMSQTFTQPEEMEEGQEEWLSEGLLTDDDYNPDNSATDPDKTRSDLDSQGVAEEVLEESVQEEHLQEEHLQEERLQEEFLQEETVQDVNESVENGAVENQEVTTNMEDSNIEQTLNSMDATQAPSDGLDEYLMRNESGQPNEVKEESDGNDTDDLLRMLEDDDKSKKVRAVNPARPKPREPKPAHPSSDEDDDGYIFNGTTVRKLKLAKNALVMRNVQASKAEPEESTDDESSSDDAATMRKMFSGRKQSKPAGKPQRQPPKTVAKQVVRLASSAGFKQAADKKLVTSTPLRQVSSGRTPARTLVKVQQRPSENAHKIERKPEPEHEEIINEEEFLEDEDIDLREDFAVESDASLNKRGQDQLRLMQPEQMDEDMLSDPDSHDDDASLYDELPSSESDETEEWFTLDVRAERAADYLPLLGPKAYDLLVQEKARVSRRLGSLRENLSAMTASGRRQAARLRAATAALADVDDMLKAA